MRVFERGDMGVDWQAIGGVVVPIFIGTFVFMPSKYLGTWFYAPVLCCISVVGLASLPPDSGKWTVAGCIVAAVGSGAYLILWLCWLWKKRAKPSG